MTLDKFIAMPGSGTADRARCHLGRIEGLCVCVGALAQGMGGQADTDAWGGSSSSSLRTARERKGRYTCWVLELNLQKYRSSSWRRISQHNGNSPVPALHVIGPPGAIPLVRPRGRCRTDLYPRHPRHTY